MTSLALTITETLRYRGKLGQWSWALHRISGLGTLFFLFLHVVDTSWATFYPALYTEAIKDYQTPLFTIGEFILVACVVYHSLNGFRMILLDTRPQWWKYQARAATIVIIASLVIIVPSFLIMFAETLRHYTKDVPNFGIDTFRIPQIIADNAQFAAAIVVILIVGLLASLVYSLVPGANQPHTTLKRSAFDQVMWTYMRVSGVLMLPLVLGHIAMMHVIQGVFHLTTANFVPVGTTAFNLTGSAIEFVSIRWNTMFAGVAIWRVYDVLMLVLVAIHGFYGLNYALNDYVHSRWVNRGLRVAAILTAVGLITLGGAAILKTIPVDTAQMLSQASASVPIP